MKKIKYAVLLGFSISNFLLSYCQDRNSVVLTKYTQNEGLSSYFITKIIKDSYGFMWIGTQEGLNLFDGKSFSVYSAMKGEKKVLGGSFIADLAEDKRNHLLWVLTSYGDITAIDLVTRTIRKRISYDQDSQPLSGKWVRCIAIQGDTLWIGGSGVLSAFQISKNRFLSLNLIKQLDLTPGECNLSHMLLDSQNCLWLFSEGFGIIALDKSLNIRYSVCSELAGKTTSTRKLVFWDATFNKDMLFVGTSWGLRKISLSANSANLINDHPLSVVDTSEILSLACSGNQLFCSSPDQFYTYNLLSGKLNSYHDLNTDDDWLGFTYQIYPDTIAGKVWVGTQAGLASFISGKTPFNQFSKSSFSNTRIRHAFSLLPVSADKVYCGDEQGVFSVNLNNKEIIKIDTASSNLLLFRDLDGTVFLSNKNGLFIIDGKSVKSVYHQYPSLKIVDKDRLNGAVQFNDSIYLFSSLNQRGLYLWNRKSQSIKIYHNDSSNHVKGLRIINNLYKGKKDNVFILTENSVIEFFPLTALFFTHDIKREKSKDPLSNFMDMCETDNSFWIATYGSGLIETDKNFVVKRIITTIDGLCNNCIYRIFPYRNKFIYSTTNNGLSVIDITNYAVQNYYQSDGLHSNSFEQLSGYYAKDKMYAGGLNGFTIIDPTLFTNNAVPPKLYLNRISIKTSKGTIDTTNIFLDNIIIPNNVLNVTISFSALNFSNPLRVNYAYQIPGVNNEWINIGNQNFISLIGLGPGEYKVLVKSSNEDGVWNIEPLVLSLKYLPKWYQTVLFKLLIIFLTLISLYFTYRYRISQLRKQQKIRKDVANDLHDDIGSTLTAAKVYAHLARDNGHSNMYIERLEESLAQVTLSLRDIIWVLDDSDDSLYQLAERIKKFAIPLAKAQGINIEFTINDEKNRPISKTEKRNLLLMIKEAINNCIKHAECSKIEVSIERLANWKIIILIRDNGKGFDNQKNYEGYGLNNIKFRALQISYTANLTSSQSGTTLEIKS